MRVWDLETLALLRLFNFETLGVHTVAVRGGPHPLLITGSYYGAMEVCALRTATPDFIYRNLS